MYARNEVSKAIGYGARKSLRKEFKTYMKSLWDGHQKPDFGRYVEEWKRV